MKRQREVSLADRIERVERGDIHQMDQFKSGLVPGVPSCINDLVLDYVLHDHQNCEKCDRFYCYYGCGDSDCDMEYCTSCGMDLCGECAVGDVHDVAWMYCNECDEFVCGNCLHQCSCGFRSSAGDLNCHGCDYVREFEFEKED